MSQLLRLVVLGSQPLEWKLGSQEADRGVFHKAPEIRATECWVWAWGPDRSFPRHRFPRGRIFSDSRVGHDIASNHTVRRLFPSQLSCRISISVSGGIQEEGHLAGHTFNASLAWGSSRPLRNRELARAFGVKLVQLSSDHMGLCCPFYNHIRLWPVNWCSVWFIVS